MKPKRFADWLVIGACMIFSGCAAPEAPYVHASNPNDPKLIFRSTGMPMPVDFSVSNGEKPCDSFRRVGTVRDSGRGVLLPWIADLSEKFNKTSGQMETRVAANATLYVKGGSNWYGPNSRGSCGPIERKFTADAARTYLVEFVWIGTAACDVWITDTTDPTKPQSVPMAPFYCPRSLF